MGRGEEELMPNQQLSKNYKKFRYVPNPVTGSKQLNFFHKVFWTIWATPDHIIPKLTKQRGGIWWNRAKQNRAATKPQVGENKFRISHKRENHGVGNWNEPFLTHGKLSRRAFLSSSIVGSFLCKVTLFLLELLNSNGENKILHVQRSSKLKESNIWLKIK